MSSTGSMRAFPFATFIPNKLGLERSKELEWVIPNKLGGYSSSTVMGLNSDRYHGLLVSGCEHLRRMVYLQKLDEDIEFGNFVIGLHANEYPAGEISDGYRYLNKFEFSYNSVSFYYRAKGVNVTKRLTPLSHKNALLAFYSIHNDSDERIRFRVNVMANSRGSEKLTKEEIEFQPRFFTKNIIGISSPEGYMTLQSDKAACFESSPEQRWRSLFYSKDGTEEYSHCPAYFTMDLEPDSSEEFTITSIAYPTEEETAQAFKELLQGHDPKSRILSSERGTSIFSLLNVADTFIIDVDSKKTIVAGYPYPGDRGRDAMIALPGLTLINGRYGDAEQVLEHFLNNATHRGIPSRFSEGKPEYGDIDTNLWLMDRLYQYIKYVGMDKGKGFLHTYWWILKDIMEHYSEMERDGILYHEGGTWMSTLERNNAVEVQGLWYNALRIMEMFAKIMGDTDEGIFRSKYLRFEEAFLEKFWNGKYLSDSLGDDSLRPNQMIVLSLDFNVLGDSLSKGIMEIVERELLTPFGIRSLSPGDSNYVGCCDAQVGEKSLYNGGVWPWLLGPYIKVYTKLYGKRLKAQEILDGVFEHHIKEVGIGTVSEFLDGDPPFKPRGATSYSCSVAELLRCYFEDIMGRRLRTKGGSLIPIQ
jgi:predicted glycogen debranching enzyme